MCKNRLRNLPVVNRHDVEVDEPGQGVLVHGVNVGHVGHTEEQDLCVDGHGDVLTASHVNILLCLLSHHHFGLVIKNETKHISRFSK